MVDFRCLDSGEAMHTIRFLRGLAVAAGLSVMAASAAALAYAQAAVAGGNAHGEDEASRFASDVLLHMADLKVTGSGEVRDRVLNALQVSSALPGIDIIAYLGANARVSHDLHRDRWKSVRARAGLAETLTGRGASYAAEAYRFGLLGR